MQTIPGVAYAQTNVQLLNQLRRGGYTVEDLETICRAYGCATELFSGAYRGSGKPFVAHLVGTASVLASLQLPIVTVAAGLLHAAYAFGDFGAGWLGLSDVKRRRLREHVSEPIEDLVVRYTLQRWEPGTPAAWLASLASGAAIDRDVALLRLANEVDDHFDAGILFCRGAAERLHRVETLRASWIELAQRLGYPALAAALEQVIADCLSGDVEEVLHTHSDAAFVVPTISRFRWRLRRVADRLRR